MMKLRCEAFVTLLIAGILYSGCLDPTPSEAQAQTCATPPAADNSTRCANTMWVNAAIAAAVPSITVGVTVINSGTSGRFLYDNAGILGEATVTGSLGSVVLSVSPALTGTPAAPTAAFGTNTTQIATTAFVQAATASLTLPQANLFVGNASNVAMAKTPGQLAVFYATAYGVLCDGSTNDTSAINSAILAAATSGGVVQLPASATKCIINGDSGSGSSVLMKSNVWLRGAGQGATTVGLLISNGTTNLIMGLASAGGVSNMKLSDFTLDGGNFLTVNNAVFFGDGVSDIVIERVSVIKFGAFAFALQGATRYRIADSYCSLTTATGATANECINISDGVQSTGGLMSNNVLINSGLAMSGSYTVMSNNNISGFKYGAGITTAASSKTHHLTFSNNVIGNSTGIDVNSFEPAGIENWGPYSTISGNVLYSNAGNGIYNGGQNTTVTGNVAVDNGTHSGGAGIFSQYSDATFNANNSIYAGNESFNTLGAGGTQTYGYSENASVTGIILGANKFDTNITGAVNNVSGVTSVGLTVGTSGGIPYYASTSRIASSAVMTASRIVLGGGAGAAPTVLGSLGTTTTLLHGNAAGAPTFGAVVSADLNITTTTCTNQFITAISAAAAGTCTTATLASAQFANQGTTATVLHGNAAGNPSFGSIALSELATQATNTVVGNATSGTAVPTALAVGTCSTASSALMWTTNTGFGCNTSITASSIPVGGITGLGTGVATWLATPSSANLISAVTDETGSGALVFANTPTLVTPVIGAATGTSLNVTGSITSSAGNVNALGANFVTNTAGFAQSKILNSNTGQFSSAGFLFQVGGAGMGNQSGTAMFQIINDAGASQGGFQISQYDNTGTFVRNVFVADYQAQSLSFLTSGSSRLGVNSSGVVTMPANVTSTSKTTGTLVVTGGLANSGAHFTDTLSVITMANTATTSAVCYNTSTGLVTYDGTIGTCTVSLLAAKDLTIPLAPQDGFAIVMALQPWRYTMKKDLPTYVAGEQIGFVADYAAKIGIVRSVVAYNHDGSLAGFRYENYTAALTAAFQYRVKVEDDRYVEVDGRIFSGEVRISQLEAEIVTLKAANDNLTMSEERRKAAD